MPLTVRMVSPSWNLASQVAPSSWSWLPPFRGSILLKADQKASAAAGVIPWVFSSRSPSPPWDMIDRVRYLGHFPTRIVLDAKEGHALIVGSHGFLVIFSVVRAMLCLFIPLQSVSSMDNPVVRLNEQPLQITDLRIHGGCPRFLWL